MRGRCPLLQLPNTTTMLNTKGTHTPEHLEEVKELSELFLLQAAHPIHSTDQLPQKEGWEEIFITCQASLKPPNAALDVQQH